MDPISNSAFYLNTAYGVCFITLFAVAFWLVYDRKNLRQLESAIDNDEEKNEK